MKGIWRNKENTPNLNKNEVIFEEILVSINIGLKEIMTVCY